MSRAVRLLLPALAALSFGPGAALAWDSRCAFNGAECTEGRQAAKGRWVDALGKDRDEHARIFRQTLALAGAQPDADFTLTSFTSSTTTFQPSSFATAAAALPRIHNVSEFAQLPDWSYSLWDWALGNETCPTSASVGPDDCHTFAGHMGAANSSHFPPQTRTNYLRYHALAMARAADCKALRTTVSSRADLASWVQACVQEALVLEAIGHHYLQDSWSMGHTWQRWGSPDPADFPGGGPSLSYATALAVGAVSGLLHGGRSVLMGLVPTAVTNLIDFNDAMNAPWPDVGYSSPSGPVAAVGDMYLPLLEAGATTTYAAEFNGLYACAVGGVRAVLGAAGETLGTVSGGLTPIDPSTNPTGCFGQRATNLSMRRGYFIDVKVNGTQHSLPLEGLAAGLSVVGLGGNELLGPAPGLLQADLIRVGFELTYAAWRDPNGTTMAEGGMGPLLGTQPNGAFDKLGSYIDPDLPWPGAGAAPDPNKLALARQFHRAHAKDWCDRFRASDAEYDLELLRSHVAAATGPARDTACTVCAEFVQRHLRAGDPATYVATTANEPLCGLIASSPGSVQYVYEPGEATGADSRLRLATRHCGCDGLEAGAGTFYNQAAGTVGTAFLARLRDASGALPAVESGVSVLGPPGWNGGQVLLLPYPAGTVRQHYVTAVPAVSGSYTVLGQIGGAQAGSVTVTVDASHTLLAPNPVVPDLTTPGVVKSSWSAVPGAVSYLTRIFDITTQRVLAPMVPTTATNADLGGVIVNGADQNALQVFAFSTDLTPPDPAIPARFDASFSRTILPAKVTITPAGGAVQFSSTTALTAAVSGLPAGGVNWSTSCGTLTASGLTATFTAPASAFRCVVTATSTGNPAFRAYAAFYSQSSGGGGGGGGGGGACDPLATAQRFAGAWKVTGVAVAGPGAQNCATVPEFAQVLKAGTLQISAGGSLNPGSGLASLTGQFSCEPSESFADQANGDFALIFGSPLAPDDVTQIRGLVLLRTASPKIIPCQAQVQGAR